LRRDPDFLGKLLSDLPGFMLVFEPGDIYKWSVSY
jgi:hypothetical protein